MRTPCVVAATVYTDRGFTIPDLVGENKCRGGGAGVRGQQLGGILVGHVFLELGDCPAHEDNADGVSVPGDVIIPPRTQLVAGLPLAAGEGGAAHRGVVVIASALDM